ncbi:MAG TPA: YIP1 family protein [Symbiobacteriaceae bacterium]|nr:YIP1 family protein [Symbiobacteriaceae bacterium]
MTYQEPTVTRPAGPSPWKALVKVITEPGATFRAFGGRVPVAPGYLVEMLFSLAGTLLAMPVALRIAEQTLLATPGYTPQMMSFARWSGILGGAFFALAGPWLAGVLVSLFAMFFGQFQEERVPFTSYLGMIGYARISLSIHALLNGILVMALGGQTAEFKLSLAALAPNGSSLLLKTFLGTLNPFGIWYYCLLAIGFAALHRAKPAKGVGLIATIYVLSFLMTYGLAALGGKFAPQM